ncbi:MAG: DUF177 domain-containing protein [Ignavibacteria bacterium]|nr:DUF177 domain-containing protein [Ignavibacteria bacterium]
MKINIHNLRETETEFKFKVSRDDVNTDILRFISDIKVNARVIKTGGQVDVRVNISGDYEYECDRCLDSRKGELDKNFEIVFKYGLRNAESGYDTDDDIKFIAPNTQVVNIDQDVRDFIFLSMPMKNAPEEIDGICTGCHKSVEEIIQIKKENEINPVWEKLIKNK